MLKVEKIESMLVCSGLILAQVRCNLFLINERTQERKLSRQREIPVFRTAPYLDSILLILFMKIWIRTNVRQLIIYVSISIDNLATSRNFWSTQTHPNVTWADNSGRISVALTYLSRLLNSNPESYQFSCRPPETKENKPDRQNPVNSTTSSYFSFVRETNRSAS